MQILHEEEVLESNDFVLTYSKRNSLDRIYTDMVQVKIRATRIHDLQLKALELFGDEDSTVNTMKIVKHVPH